MFSKRERTLFERLHDRILRLRHGPRYHDRSWSLREKRRAKRRSAFIKQAVLAALIFILGGGTGAGLTLLLEEGGRQTTLEAAAPTPAVIASMESQAAAQTSANPAATPEPARRVDPSNAPAIQEELLASFADERVKALLQSPNDETAASAYQALLSEAYGFAGGAPSAPAPQESLDQEAARSPQGERSGVDPEDTRAPPAAVTLGRLAAVTPTPAPQAPPGKAADDNQVEADPQGVEPPEDPVAREIAEAMRELAALEGAGAAAQAAAPSRQTWLANAAPFAREAGKPMIAIVIDDLGMNGVGTRRSIDLPPPVTLAFLTYAEGLESLTARAKTRGHELMVHVPMEPLDRERNYPGPEALSVDLTEAEIEQRLDWALSRFSGFVGINNHMGSRFTASGEGMRVVLRRLQRDGLLFLDSVTSQGSVAYDMAQRLDLPSARRDVFLDHEQDSDFVWRQLAEVETLARRNGAAIAIGHPHGATLQALEAWIPDAKARGFQFVPVSAVVRERQTGLAWNAATD